jgi:hypothetical protein
MATLTEHNAAVRRRADEFARFVLARQTPIMPGLLAQLIADCSPAVARRLRALR